MDVWGAGHYLYWRIFGRRKHGNGRPCSSRLFNEQYIMHWYPFIIKAETVQIHNGVIQVPCLVLVHKPPPVKETRWVCWASVRVSLPPLQLLAFRRPYLRSLLESLLSEARWVASWAGVSRLQSFPKWLRLCIPSLVSPLFSRPLLVSSQTFLTFQPCISLQPILGCLSVNIGFSLSLRIDS